MAVFVRTSVCRYGRRVMRLIFRPFPSRPRLAVWTVLVDDRRGCAQAFSRTCCKKVNSQDVELPGSFLSLYAWSLRRVEGSTILTRQDMLLLVLSFVEACGAIAAKH